MKKRFLFISIIVFLMHCLTACSLLVYEIPSLSINEPTNATTKNQDEVEKSTVIATKSPTEEIPTAPILNEQVIYDQNDIVVTVIGMSYDGWRGPEISLLIENNSTRNITIQPRNSSVNGYMMDFQMSADVVSGKKAYDEMSIRSDDLEIANIDTITDIEFSLHIFESVTYDTIADSDQISLSTTDAPTYVQTYDDSGVILYDENDIRIISKGISLDSNFFGPELILYIENNSGKHITIQARDTSVNGFMVNPIMSDEIMPGKKIITGMTFSASRLEENKISSIETIETVFHVFDTNTYDDIIRTNPITVTIDN